VLIVYVVVYPTTIWSLKVRTMQYRILCLSITRKSTRYVYIYTNVIRKLKQLEIRFIKSCSSVRCVLNTTLCDKICQWIAAGLWFSPSTPISSTNKIDSYDITEKLNSLKLYFQWMSSDDLPFCYIIYLFVLFCFVCVFTLGNVFLHLHCLTKLTSPVIKYRM
jgi:hypothetical protein